MATWRPPTSNHNVRTEREKTMAKNDDKIAELLALVGNLSAQVEEMKAARVAPEVEKRSSKKGTPRLHVFYELLGYPKEKFPPQCLRVMRCLAQAAPEGGKMTEVEVWDALMGEKSTIGPWHYRQDPFYIFKYYRAQMIDGDYLRGPFQS